MNYVEQFVKDNDLSINEKFKIEVYGEILFHFDHNFELYNSGVTISNFVALSDILSGSSKIIKEEKKPTLLKQIIEQGHYYFITCEGRASRIGYDAGLWDSNVINQGNAFLTEYDAVKEIFKRNLVFRMQEFAREHNKSEISWESEKYKYSLCVRFLQGETRVETHSTLTYKTGLFDIYFPSVEIATKAIEMFENDIKRYFTWKS